MAIRVLLSNGDSTVYCKTDKIEIQGNTAHFNSNGQYTVAGIDADKVFADGDRIDSFVDLRGHIFSFEGELQPNK